MKIEDVKTDCRYFRGSVPCEVNKTYGSNCSDCNEYEKSGKKILIIKLGAAGDVIRTTPLLHPLRRIFPNSKIFWLTHYPRFVPLTSFPNADIVLRYDTGSIQYLTAMSFDLVINLDKDPEAIGLMNNLNSRAKSGFVLKDGYCYPADKNAEHKFLTGIDDKYSKQNTKSYVQEIFEICGFSYRGERYVIDQEDGNEVWLPLEGKRGVIGLNTGSGERWKTRLWKDENWIELSKMLTGGGFEVILLGGDPEHKRNQHISESSDAKYFGVFDLGNFVNIVNKCDIVVSQVTMCMHLAIALGKKLVLMNNIFNKNEFELFGNGIVIEPEKDCRCYFRSDCRNDEYYCMDHISSEAVYAGCLNLVGELKIE